MNSYKAETTAVNKPLALILASGLILSFIHSANQLIDDFAYSNVALATLYKEAGRLVVEPFHRAHGFFVHHINDLSHRPLSSMLFAVADVVAGIDSSKLIYFPFIGFYSFIIIYIIARYSLEVPPTIAALISVLGVNINANVVLGATFYYISIGYSLAFLSIYLIKRFIVDAESRMLYLILFFNLVAPYIYYTMAFIINIAIISSIFIYIIHRRAVHRPLVSILNSRRGVLVTILLAGIISFLNERTPYTIISEYTDFSEYLRNSIEFILNILHLNIKSGGAAAYKPIFIKYGYLFNIFQKIFIITFIMSFVVSLVAVFIYGLRSLRLLRDLRGYFTVLLWATVTTAHAIVYLSVGEINPLMIFIFMGLVVGVALRELVYSESRRLKVLSWLVVGLLAASVAAGFAKQTIFSVDNMYGRFFERASPVGVFADSFTNHSCVSEPINMFMYHHTLAYVTYLRVKGGVSDCVYPAYILIDERAPELIRKYLSSGSVDVYYVHHLFAPYVRIGVKGVHRNVLVEVLESGGMHDKLEVVYNDGLSLVERVNPGSLVGGEVR